jgi:hypothetical protein
VEPLVHRDADPIDVELVPSCIVVLPVTVALWLRGKL